MARRYLHYQNWIVTVVVTLKSQCRVVNAGIGVLLCNVIVTLSEFRV